MLAGLFVDTRSFSLFITESGRSVLVRTPGAFVQRPTASPTPVYFEVAERSGCRLSKEKIS